MDQQIVPLPAQVRLMPRSQWDRRRREARYHCGPATLGQVSTVVSGEIWHGWVLDLSSHGAGVLLTQPLEAGTLIILHIKNNAGDRNYEFSGRIVHATTQRTGDWLLGCEFIDPLTPDDLDALL
jgi:PilZ domain